MTRAELKPIYVEASIRARTKPNKSEEDLWFREFEYADPRDLKAAIEVHFTREQWMPKEGQLRPLIDQAQRSRFARLSARQELVTWQCETCRVTRSGFIEPSDSTRRYCQGVPRKQYYGPGEICGGNMTEVYRGAA